MIQRQGLCLDFACLSIYSLAIGPELFAWLSIYENAETCPLGQAITRSAAFAGTSACRLRHKPTLKDDDGSLAGNSELVSLLTTLNMAHTHPALTTCTPHVRQESFRDCRKRGPVNKTLYEPQRLLSPQRSHRGSDLASRQSGGGQTAVVSYEIDFRKETRTF